MATNNRLAKWISLSNAYHPDKQCGESQKRHKNRQAFCSGQHEKAVEDEVTAQAIYDAHQLESSVLREEAIQWLWVCCPDIAEDLELPVPINDL